MPTTSIEDAKRQMTSIRASLKRAVDSINSGDRYTDAGRRQELAKIILAHRKQARTLRDSCSLNNDETRAKLTLKLFGLPPSADASSIPAYRDAVDRASKLRSPKALSDALQRANAMGDHLLARAIAGRAHELNIREVVDTYAETSGQSDDYDDLKAIPSNQFASAALFGVPIPAELRGIVGGVSDSQLERIADGES